MSAPFVLASSSPRRREILSRILSDFEVVPTSIDETPIQSRTDLSPEGMVMQLALLKGRKTLESHPDALILAADTMVFLDGVPMGKPKSMEVAALMLKALQGRTHDVYTGWCLLNSKTQILSVSQSQVRISPMSNEEIVDYVETLSPMDKAGAYGIQDAEYIQATVLKGSLTNVMGLPLEDVRMALQKHFPEVELKPNPDFGIGRL